MTPDSPPRCVPAKTRPARGASHWGASDAAGLYLALGDEAEVPVPLVGSDALVAPRPATARSVTRQRAVGLVIVLVSYIDI